ncbi:MAG: plasmid maintenance protein CcdB [Gammaproteobacteria bacterium]|nr:MAG: plasmid maintenance protein CcdB [Gammaproteobacteria bacterium]
MAQFDIQQAKANPRTRATVPYLLVPLATRVLIPLLPADSGSQPVEKLNPVIEHEGRSLMLSTAEMAGVPLAALGERIGSLAGDRDQIVAAIDFLV